MDMGKNATDNGLDNIDNRNDIVMNLNTTTPQYYTPVSNCSGVTGSIPGILTVSDTSISAGKTTDTKLIKTMLIENRKTIHGIMTEFTLDSVFSALLLFSNLFFLEFACLKSAWIVVFL